MGKVTIYYQAHIGTGAFDNPAFREAFGKASVIDIEAGEGMDPQIASDLRRAAQGNKDAYGRLVSHYRVLYDFTGDRGLLNHLDLVDLIFNSRKKLEFEKKLGERQRYYGRVRRLFPGVRKYSFSAEAAKLIEKAVAGEKKESDRAALRAFLKREYRGISRLEIDTLVRAFADGERIARRMKADPGQNRLVLRGAKHEVTTKFLRDANVPVEDLHMPVRYNVAGTPLHGLSYSGFMGSVRSGRPITAPEIIRSHLERALIGSYLSRGWSTPDAVSQIGFISQRLGPADLNYLASHPTEIGSYIAEKKKLDPFVPWWKRASHESLPFAKKLVFGAKRLARGYGK